MPGLLEGKVCMVSGVGPGLGREIALACGRQGASVALLARTEAFLEKVAAELRSLGAPCLVAPTDITDRAACDAAVQGCVETFGRLDVLVNSAYRPDVFQLFENVDLARWREIMDVNLFGSLGLTQAALAPMKAARSGSVVFVNSMIIRKVLPLQGGYAASKGALLTAAQVLARELGDYGIRVNSVVPGWMWGPPVEGYVDMTAAQRGVDRQQVIDEISGRITLGSMPTDDDTAEVVVFLASDMSRAMTGEAVDVNGGEVFH